MVQVNSQLVRLLSFEPLQYLRPFYSSIFCSALVGLNMPLLYLFFCFSLPSFFHFSRATKPRLRKNFHFFWNLCITLLNLNAAHSKFISLSFTSYRCWWVQKWKPWLSREWNLFKHRWILWMCLQRWILWRRTHSYRLVTKIKVAVAVEVSIGKKCAHVWS